MKNSEDNISYNFTIKYFIIAFFLSIIISCGPRTGIHDDNADKETKEQTGFVCGNALDNSNKNAWAEKNLSIKGDAYNGQKLFKQNCAVCHDITDRKLTGPGLAGVLDRVPKPAEEYLIKYILNNQKVLLSGDPYAQKVHSENGTSMTVFEDQLTEQEIKDIIIYVVGQN